MKTVCLVNNYNYAHYLEECLQSLFSQTLKFDRIIVVDDGSTDGSQQLIGTLCRDRSEVVCLAKANGGQLSCFNAAADLIEPDDVVFFLDADDLYPCDYLERITPFLEKSKADFFFVNPVEFRDGERPLQSAGIGADSTFTFSSTSALTRNIRCWIGAETSCISMRGSLYRSLLPYPYQRDWITRADDLLVHGSSILGAHKLYIESLGIGYRIHGNNHYAGRELSASELADWRLRSERLFRWYTDRNSLPLHAPLKNALQESLLIPKRMRERFAVPSTGKVFLFDQRMYISSLKLILKDLTGQS